MTSKRKIGSAKKFGPRYGRTIKEKYGKIDAMQKSKYLCPVCNYKKVRRVNLGIWQCEKCNAKFASKAYHVPRVSVKDLQEQEEQTEQTESVIDKVEV